MPRINRNLLQSLDSLINALNADRDGNPARFSLSPEEKLLSELLLARYMYVSSCSDSEHDEETVDL